MIARDMTRLMALSITLLLAVVPARAEDEERPPGVITLSDGTAYSGPIRTTNGKPLRLFETGTGRRLDLAMPEIFRIRIHITQEEQYREWRWVEDGSREKVYTGASYPKREYETEITLRSGRVHRGGTVAVLYVYPEGSAKPKKVILRKKDQGELGEKLDDLVYVESVQFTGPAPEVSGSMMGILLEVDPPDLLVAAHALPRERNRSVEARVDPISGRAWFEDVLPGAYDLAVVTEDGIYLTLAVGAEGGAPLEGEALSEIKARVAEVPDFFEVREVLAGVRDGKLIRVLVRKTRTGKTSMDGNRTFRRWEIWSMHRGGDRWLVDNRSYLWREHGEELPPPRGVTLVKGLARVRVSSGIVEHRFVVPGRDDR